MARVPVVTFSRQASRKMSERAASEPAAMSTSLAVEIDVSGCSKSDDAART